MKKIPDSVQKFFELNKINAEFESSQASGSMMDTNVDDTTSADENAIKTPSNAALENASGMVFGSENGDLLEEDAKENPEDIEKEIARQALEDAESAKV